MGPIVKVQPVGTGTGAVIAIVTDPNYEVRSFFKRKNINYRDCSAKNKTGSKLKYSYEICISHPIIMKLCQTD